MQKAEVYQLVQFQARNQTSFRNEWLLCVYIYIYMYIKTPGSSAWIIKTQPLAINDFLFDPNQCSFQQPFFTSSLFGVENT